LRRISLFISDKDYNHFIELAKNLHYVKKIELDESDQTKEEILNGLRQAVKEVKKVKASELKARLLKDLKKELKDSDHSIL
jgi:hypothetical protein